MPAFTCDFCNTSISAEDRETLVALVSDHFEGEHAEYGIKQVNVRNYFDALDRLSGDTQRRETIGPVTTMPVGPEILDDVLVFFDRDAFAGKPEWAFCYCMVHHLDRQQGGTRTWQENRADLERRIGEGRTTGIVAYVDGKVVGWCNASLRREFPEHVTGSDEDEEVLVTRCFQVAPPFRGHGIARKLLDAAVAMARERGCTAVEGFPNPEARDDATAYPGPVALYEGAGFEVEGGHARLRL